jgi:single-strand DNA-binding protein
VNTVALIGNLATEVEVRDVGEGKRVASFLVAVDRWTKEGGADFLRISAWDHQAELCGQYLSKGQRVGIEGYLRTRSWEEEGKRRRDFEVVARRVQFLARRETEAEAVPFEPAVVS